MICILCKQAETRPGHTSVTLEHADVRLVVTDVPALICPDCGEAYADEETATCLLAMAADMQSAGLEADVKVYAAG
jgi:YgiT-type zinc finger domain-containing protein